MVRLEIRNSARMRFTRQVPTSNSVIHPLVRRVHNSHESRSSCHSGRRSRRSLGLCVKDQREQRWRCLVASAVWIWQGELITSRRGLKSRQDVPSSWPPSSAYLVFGALSSYNFGGDASSAKDSAHLEPVSPLRVTTPSSSSSTMSPAPTGPVSSRMETPFLSVVLKFHSEPNEVVNSGSPGRRNGMEDRTTPHLTVKQSQWTV